MLIIPIGRHNEIIEVVSDSQGATHLRQYFAIGTRDLAFPPARLEIWLNISTGAGFKMDREGTHPPNWNCSMKNTEVIGDRRKD